MCKKVILCCLVFALVGIAVSVPSAMAVLNLYSKPTVYNNTPLHCADLITGGTNQNRNDAHFVCQIEPLDIVYRCTNKGGNADNSKSHIFVPADTTLTKVDFGKDFVIQKNGRLSADIEFTDANISDALTAAGLDLATLCPNRNYSIEFVITNANVFVDLLTGPSTDTCLPTDFKNCDPTTNGVDSACTQNECYYLTPCSKPDPDSFVQENYNCTCAQHYENGTLTTTC